MFLNINKKCHIIFNAAFETLNGIYQVEEIYSYNQILEQEIDLYELLYKLVGKDEETDLLTDLANYTDGAFFKLKELNGTTIIVVPESIVMAANVNIKQYYSTMLQVNLGTFEDPVVIHPLVNIILDTLKDRLGNPNQTIESLALAESLADILDLNANLQVYDREWMLTSEYKNIVIKRRQSQHKAKTFTEDVSNYCDKYLTVLKELQIVKDRNTVLEQKIIELMEST